jgi:hypothetical protein
MKKRNHNPWLIAAALAYAANLIGWLVYFLLKYR